MAKVAGPVLLIGAGHMGGALVAGWRRAAALTPHELLIRDPYPGREALAAAAWGAALNPTDDCLSSAGVVVLAVKPQAWRATAAQIAPLLAPDATIVSIIAGVGSADLTQAFAGRPIARVMPTTAAAIGKGAASVWAPGAATRALARDLFSPLGTVVDLADETLMHVATGASGSAPAYFYALVEGLAAAGVAAGLEEHAARDLSRATLIGAAALLETSGEDAATLRRQVTSPNGTTQAALDVLIGQGALEDLMTRAVAAAAARSRELGG